ncbi:hypothetical protein [Acaryochloris marina]|uniref:hypothetical protein n=1 Tax=Acaryochloris marina TaxID=155978 RepID=UPI001BB0248A|nr:hypothetical protein [Acaryochloris marina]QUY40811.1 hypothetical protein I1H34_16005 [Acaryochloris marina S15]
MVNPGIFLAIGLAVVHAFFSKLTIPAFIPHHKWLSFAGGVSIGFVFLEIFPELSHAQEEIEHAQLPLLIYLENHVYLLALLGLVVFYGLDSLVLQSRKANQDQKNTDNASTIIFWIHISAFALLNVILGYLLQDLGAHSLYTCILFFAALALHFFIIDHHLYEHHKTPYNQRGRWLLVAAIILGMILGQAAMLDKAGVLVIWSFLAGSIILNVLKRELPDEQESCFMSFIVGAALFTGLLLAK